MPRTVLSAGVCAVAAAFAAQAQAPDFDEVVIEGADLGSGIHMLTGLGGNIGLLVGDDGVFMIDDQFTELTDKIAAEVDAIAGEGASGNVRFLVNTHYHFDHTGGNADWYARGSTVVAHDNVRTRLSTPQTSSFTGEEEPAKPADMWPVVTYPDAMSFYVNGQTVRLRHVPSAHTDGDTIVYFEEANIVHMGDVFFHGAFPFIDVNGGGSLEGYIAAQELALSYINDDTQIIPGHGPMATKADLEADMEVLIGVRDTVAPLVAEGMSVEDIVAANPLADLDAQWGQGFMDTPTFTRLVAMSLSAVGG